MNLREAYKALLDGKKVRDAEGDVWQMRADGDLECGYSRAPVPMNSDYAHFEIVEEPATDEELTAEMVKRGEMAGIGSREGAAFMKCAAMLRTRKVKP